MKTIDEALRELIRLTLDGAGAAGQLSFPPLLQGFPDAAHGGGLLAAFGRVARACVPDRKLRRLAAVIHRTIPLDTLLQLTAARGEHDLTLTLKNRETVLAEATAENSAELIEAGAFERWRERNGNPLALPTTRGCLACGSENPLGCQLALRFDDRWLWSEHWPRPPFRSPNGTLDPALFPILLDEVGWWLGALRTGEAGVTTEVSTTLHCDDVAFDGPLTLLGEHGRVTARDEKGHFWETAGAVFSARGSLLASARVTYAASRVYSKRLVPLLAALNPSDSVRRVFPRHVL